eukprot:252230_1
MSAVEVAPSSRSSPFRCNNCAKCLKRIRKGDLRILSCRYRYKQNRYHVDCFATTNHTNCPSLTGLEQFYAAEDMKGFDSLPLDQQTRVKAAVNKFHSQFITMYLPKHIEELSYKELRKECKKRCLRWTSLYLTKISTWELRDRLKAFISNAYFLKKRNELLIHGYIRNLQKKKKYKHLNIPVYLLQIMIEHCPFDTFDTGYEKLYEILN